MEVDGQQPAASTSGRKLFVGSQELGYKRPHMEVRVHMCCACQMSCHVYAALEVVAFHFAFCQAP